VVKSLREHTFCFHSCAENAPSTVTTSCWPPSDAGRRIHDLFIEVKETNKLVIITQLPLTALRRIVVNGQGLIAALEDYDKVYIRNSIIES
jgi:hypothetical protein